MLSILKALLGFQGIADKIADAYMARQNAATDRERVAADERVKTLEAQRDVLVAETAAGGPQSWVRPAFALPFVIYNFKLVVWDKVLDLGSTDALSAELFQIELAVIGFYFFGSTVEKAARILRSR